MVFSYFRSYLYFSSCRKWCSISSINRRRRITIRAAPGTHFYVAFLSCPPSRRCFSHPPSTSRPNLISWIGIMPGQALSKLTYKHQGRAKSGETHTPLAFFARSAQWLGPRLWNTVWKNSCGIPREFRRIPWNSKGVTRDSGVIQGVKHAGFSTISPGGILPYIILKN